VWPTSWTETHQPIRFSGRLSCWPVGTVNWFLTGAIDRFLPGALASNTTAPWATQTVHGMIDCVRRSSLPWHRVCCPRRQVIARMTRQLRAAWPRQCGRILLERNLMQLSVSQCSLFMWPDHHADQWFARSTLELNIQHIVRQSQFKAVSYNVYVHTMIWVLRI